MEQDRLHYTANGQIDDEGKPEGMIAKGTAKTEPQREKGDGRQ